MFHVPNAPKRVAAPPRFSAPTFASICRLFGLGLILIFGGLAMLSVWLFDNFNPFVTPGVVDSFLGVAGGAGLLVGLWLCVTAATVRVLRATFPNWRT